MTRGDQVVSISSGINISHVHNSKTASMQELNSKASFAYSWTKASLVVAAFIAMLMPDLQQAKALPTDFYLQAKIQDTAAPHAFGVLDAYDTNGMLTGYIQVNQPSSSKSQLWEEVNVTTSTGQTNVVRLKNKATGLCIGDSSGNSATVTIRACDDDTTLWVEVPRGPEMAIFKRIFHNSFSFFPDIEVCISKDPNNPGLAYTDGCTGDHYEDDMVWLATSEPLGTVSSGVTPPAPPPPVPPVKPTGCKLAGTIAACGLVGFTCNPLSAADKIVVPSGNIGVNVTAIEPKLGLITATYLNQGKAAVAVCAIKSGQALCSDAIDVTFGPALCSGPPPHRTCPTGQIPCQGGCSVLSNPECHPQ